MRSRVEYDRAGQSVLISPPPNQPPPPPQSAPPHDRSDTTDPKYSDPGWLDAKPEDRDQIEDCPGPGSPQSESRLQPVPARPTGFVEHSIPPV